ncbi:MAG: glutamate synthase alpha subunit domain protein [Planctomycetaceae bacterium]|nr:glutamate synthase alpha subunit domain protein [Planctomycetaceae bacterium]
MKLSYSERLSRIADVTVIPTRIRSVIGPLFGKTLLSGSQSHMDIGTAQRLQFDLEHTTIRELNQFLHHDLRLLARQRDSDLNIEITNPKGQHNIAVGVDFPVNIDILGDAGYFVAGMNQQAHVIVHGNAGWSVAENIMSGSVRVKGCASECVGASGHGGLVVVQGDVSSRCGISMKGCDIVVGGDCGHMSAFMAQAGRLVVCGDAGTNLGDSLYEAVIYVRGKIHSLGTDARQETMSAQDIQELGTLLEQAGFNYAPQEFKRVASAKTLYHWHVDAGAHY